jgi:hypothetical protein
MPCPICSNLRRFGGQGITVYLTLNPSPNQRGTFTLGFAPFSESERGWG